MRLNMTDIQRAAITGWHEAAAQGDAEAQYRLGVLYAAGDGVPKDVVQAIRWLRKAVDQGYVEAQRKLSAMQWPKGPSLNSVNAW